MDRYPRSSDTIVQPRAGLQTFMAQVYGWMTCGLLLTAFVAWYAANTPAVMMYVFSSPARRWRPRCLCSIRRSPA